ncbi:MAG: FliH/SctL family protein [Polyangiales bacterium]
MSGAGGLRRLVGSAPWRPLATPDERLTEGWLALEAERGALRAQAVETAFALAERVLRERASRDAGVAADALRLALEEMGLEPALRVRAHPSDLPACAALLRPYGDRVALSGDDAVGQGGVIVEGASGRVDARLSVRLARLRARLGGAP